MSKKIVVIGAVAAGTKAASKARREDYKHVIKIFTDEEFISYAGCGTPYYLGDIVTDKRQLLVQSAEAFEKLKNIEVHTENRVTKINPDKKTVTVLDLLDNNEFEEPYDVLIIATGARSFVPPIQGKDLNGVFTLRSVSDSFKIKKYQTTNKPECAVVVGAGLIGLEVAENLTHAGIKVTVVELADQVLSIFDPDMAFLVEKELHAKGVEILLSESVQSFEGYGQLQSVKTDKREIQASLALLSIGIRPNIEIAKEAGIELGKTGAIKVNNKMETNIKDIFAAGDCVESTDVVSGHPIWSALGSVANKQGRVIGENIENSQSEFSGVAGTAIVKVFDVSAGRTGLSEKQAKELGYETEICYVPGLDRPGYMPGVDEIIVKLIADKKTEKLLGAQVVGKGVVDKRIDVLATAVTAGMSIRLLSQVDLAYAPPFSPAFDPIIVAANVMLNKLQGKTVAISPDNAYQKMNNENVTLLDVRTQLEWNAGHISGAIHIPLHELKQKVGELDKSKDYIVYCKAGLRAAEGFRILKNNGFKHVAYMDGSLSMWRYEIVTD